MIVAKIQVPFFLLWSSLFLHFQQPASQECRTLMPESFSFEHCIFLPDSKKIQDKTNIS